MISKQTIEQIFDRVIIEEIVGDFVQLKKRGVNYLGLCPFHNEKTPSFTVSPTKGIYKCFGCGKAGNSIRFLMDLESLTYPDALRYLAQKYGIEIREEKIDEQALKIREEKESIFSILNFANEYYNENLYKTSEGKKIAYTYLLERGFDKSIIEKFQIGYALNQKDNLLKTAIEKGYNIDFLDKAGLILKNEKNSLDRFQSRIMFPITNAIGKVLGFGGRIIGSKNNKAKYLNSPETEAYNKSKVLYGLFQSKTEINKLSNCYLVEGYTDVISMHQAGVGNTVSTSGTSLTIQQIRLIKRYTNTITLLFDGDKAGINATFRSINMLLEEEVNIFVIYLPEFEDPDSFLKNKTQIEVSKYFEEEKLDFLDFEIKVLNLLKINNPIQKSEGIKIIIESLSCISDQINRQLYIQKLSNVLVISEESILKEINKIILKKRNQKQFSVSTDLEEKRNKENKIGLTSAIDTEISFQESELIRLLLNYGEQLLDMEEINRISGMKISDIQAKEYLSILLINSLKSDDITLIIPVFKQIFDLYEGVLKEDRFPNFSEFTNNSSVEVAEISTNLIAQKYSASENWKKHGVFIKFEKDNLEKSFFYILYAYKLVRLNKILKSLIENLKKAKIENSEDTENLLQEIENKNSIKKKLTLLLGRI